jgi:DNA-binding PucR family transcriptional regulator
MAIATRHLETDPAVADLLRTQDLADFAARWLGPLLHHAELTRTLQVFLATGGPSASAARLYVHISTLKYRLRRIESILGVDLSDPEDCFNLRLAFKIRAAHELPAAGSLA